MVNKWQRRITFWLQYSWTPLNLLYGYDIYLMAMPYNTEAMRQLCANDDDDDYGGGDKRKN